MLAVKPERKGGRRPGGGAASVFPALPGGLVLPRLLRRPARIFWRLVDGSFTPPPFSAAAAALALLTASGAYGAYLGGHYPAIVQTITAHSGFAVDQVRITGHSETSEIDVIEKLELDGWTSLVGLDAESARARIQELPWVKKASVRKIYPDALEVKIEELVPFAIWQHGSRLTIVERSGEPIAPFSGNRHAALPLVIGMGAQKKAEEFIGRLKKYPGLASRVKGYIRVAERRWDLRLENGVTVKLPETGEDAAIADLLEMDRKSALLSRDIAAVDLRLPDRLVVQLTPEAALRRNAALEERSKSAGKTEKRI